MKRIITLLFMSFVVLLGYAQTEEKMVIEKTDGSIIEYTVKDIKSVSFEVPNMFSITPNALSFGWEADEQQTISVQSNMEWQIINLPSWLTASETKGNTSTEVVLTTVGMSTKEETATFFFIAGENATAVSVTREAPQLYTTTEISGTSFDASEHSAVLTIKSNTNWSIAFGDSTAADSFRYDWLSVSKVEGNGDAVIAISIAANTYASSRTALVRVIGNDKNTVGKYKITQQAADLIFTVTPENVDIPASGGNFTVSVNANAEVQIASIPEWIQLLKFKDGKCDFYTKSNILTTSRKGEIIFVAAGKEKKVIVNQAEESLVSELVFSNPCTQWGASKVDVKEYMKEYSLYKEDQDLLAYIGMYKETLILYGFVEEKLTTVSLAILKASATLTEIQGQLDQDYLFISEDNGRYMYVSYDVKTVILLQYESEIDAYTITYYDASTINTNETYFEEPYLTWNAQRSIVKSAMKNNGYSLLTESTFASDDYCLIYEGKYMESYSMYSFSTLQNLNDVFIPFLETSATVDNLNEFVTEELSYTLLGTSQDGNVSYYVTPDSKSCAIIYSTTSNNGTNYSVVEYMNIDEIYSEGRTRGVVKKADNNLSIINSRMPRVISYDIECKIMEMKRQELKNKMSSFVSLRPNIDQFKGVLK